jgi:RNA polymerase sigma-70 factor (ECF subfamily)
MSDETKATEALLACRDPADRQLLFAEHFMRNRKRLRAMVELRLDRRLQGRIDPSDVVQESYLDAARRLDDYLKSVPMPLFLWLRKLTIQRLQALYRTHLKAKERSVRREVPLPPGGVPQVSSVILASYLVQRFLSPSDAAHRREKKRRVQEALESMDPIDREVLVLRHFENFTCSAAARELGIEPAAARQRYYRALKRFKKVLTSKNPGTKEDWD